MQEENETVFYLNNNPKPFNISLSINEFEERMGFPISNNSY